MRYTCGFPYDEMASSHAYVFQFEECHSVLDLAVVGSRHGYPPVIDLFHGVDGGNVSFGSPRPGAFVFYEFFDLFSVFFSG